MSYIIIVLMTVTLSNGDKYDKVEIHDLRYKSMEQCVKHKGDITTLTEKVKINKIYCVEAQ
jgi:hypothetical protein